MLKAMGVNILHKNRRMTYFQRTVGYACRSVVKVLQKGEMSLSQLGYFSQILAMSDKQPNRS